MYHCHKQKLCTNTKYILWWCRLTCVPYWSEKRSQAHRVDHTRRLLLRLASTDLLSVILRDDTLIHSADFSGGSYTACLVQTQIVKLVKHKNCEAKCIHCKKVQHVNLVFEIIIYRPLISKNDFNKRRWIVYEDWFSNIENPTRTSNLIAVLRENTLVDLCLMLGVVVIDVRVFWGVMGCVGGCLV